MKLAEFRAKIWIYMDLCIRLYITYMPQINWQQFGLKKDPYDTLPLLEGGDLPIEEAFVGREKEKGLIDDMLSSSDSLRLIVGGDVGVGKTSLINFQKVIWKYKIEKRLFSFRREIEATKDLLTKRSFLVEILSSVLREITLLDPNLLKDKFLVKLNALVDISHVTHLSGGVSVLGIGATLDRSMTRAIPEIEDIPISTLEKYFIELVEFIKKNKINDRTYAGLIIHVNNFDIVMQDSEGCKEVINFFNEIRDVLQTPHTYFLKFFIAV